VTPVKQYSHIASIAFATASSNSAASEGPPWPGHSVVHLVVNPNSLGHVTPPAARLIIQRNGSALIALKKDAEPGTQALLDVVQAPLYAQRKPELPRSPRRVSRRRCRSRFARRRSRGNGPHCRGQMLNLRELKNSSSSAHKAEVSPRTSRTDDRVLSPGQQRPASPAEPCRHFQRDVLVYIRSSAPQSRHLPGYWGLCPRGDSGRSDFFRT